MEATKELCRVAFHVLERKLDGRAPDAVLLQGVPDVQCPLFVTYHAAGDRLRGCIGNLSPMPLREGLPKYALIAALQDTRFSPVTAAELPTLNVAVSLLVQYEDARDALDWEVGKHGIIIEYAGRSAVFLPEVAKEQGWDKETTLQHLLVKAGVREPFRKEMASKIKTVRYQSSKECITWDEYQQMCKQ